MNFQIFLLLQIFLNLHIIYGLNSNEIWEQYKIFYNLSFYNTENERKYYFDQNLKYINNHNQKNMSYKLKLTQYAHYVIL